MYNLSLNNEEFFELRCLLETTMTELKRDSGFNSRLSAVLTKLVIAQCDTQDEASEEAAGRRYAMNLHSMPEGS